MKKYIFPPLVLMIICVIVCGLLVGAYKLTYKDTTGVMTDNLKSGCEAIFTDSNGGDFKILLDSSKPEKTPLTFGNEKINSIILSSDKSKCLIEVTTDGYSKGGIHILVGINQNGEIAGTEFITCGETPGLGTKLRDKKEIFSDKFIGFTSDSNLDDVDNVIGATYSSKGMKEAIKTALEIYNDNKEAILSE